MTAFPDHFSTVAADYRAYRPTYPPELFRFLAAAAPARRLAWDCGTGTGQAAVGLAEHFERVAATDASAEQVGQADPHPRVEYAVAPAERSPLADGAADLVTVAQALHWFDRDRFYAEVRRVCRPGGVVAVWSYFLPTVGAGVDEILVRLRDTVRSYWPPERAWVDAEYRTIPFPFAELPAPRLDMTAEWDLRRLLGYIGTWSAVRAFVKANGVGPLERQADEFRAAWGDPAAVRPVRWSLTVRVGRVNA